MLLAGCTPPAQPETQAPQWGRGSNAETAPPPPAAQPQAIPSVPLDTKADGQPYGSATARPTDQTTPAPQAEIDAAAAAAGMPATPQTRTSFACDNGETVEVRFFPEQGIAVLVRGGQNTELQGEQVASGFKYSNGQTTIRGQGDTFDLNVGMMATAKCTAKA
jgi:membrane-bound inhibitor of C-type lysozyme